MTCVGVIAWKARTLFSYVVIEGKQYEISLAKEIPSDISFHKLKSHLLRGEVVEDKLVLFSFSFSLALHLQLFSFTHIQDSKFMILENGNLVT